MALINLAKELVIIEVSGADSTTYLQGQLTNDIKELQSKSFQFSAHLNNKGRIIASFIITSPLENTYWLITSKSMAEKIIPRLKMFILRSKVTLNISTKNIFAADSIIENTYSIALNSNYFLVISDQELSTQEDDNLWHKILVDSAIPMIYSDTSEKIIPQQVNYDLIGGINFKKGCYTGQEIVARTHYLGKTKRRMQQFTSKNLPIIGQTVVSPKLDNQEIGFIVDFYQENQLYYGLASLQINCSDNAYLDIENIQPLQCKSLINETSQEN